MKSLLNSLLYCNTNGLISFNNPVLNSTPEDFPLLNDFQLIAPYWADVDLGTLGVILYREASFDTALLLRVREELILVMKTLIQHSCS
jgi:hypothetical protein